MFNIEEKKELPSDFKENFYKFLETKAELVSNRYIPIYKETLILVLPKYCSITTNENLV